MKRWYDNFITKNVSDKHYTAWDETQSHELGTFDTYEEAKQAVLKHAETLEPGTNSNERTV